MGRYGENTRLACTAAKAADIQWSKMLTVCKWSKMLTVPRMLSWDVLWHQLFCSNLGPFLSTAQCTENDFNYRWTRRMSWQ